MFSIPPKITYIGGDSEAVVDITWNPSDVQYNVTPPTFSEDHKEVTGGSRSASAITPEKWYLEIKVIAEALSSGWCDGVGVAKMAPSFTDSGESVSDFSMALFGPYIGVGEELGVRETYVDGELNRQTVTVPASVYKVVPWDTNTTYGSPIFSNANKTVRGNSRATQPCVCELNRASSAYFELKVSSVLAGQSSYNSFVGISDNQSTLDPSNINNNLYSKCIGEYDYYGNGTKYLCARTVVYVTDHYEYKYYLLSIDGINKISSSTTVFQVNDYIMIAVNDVYDDSTSENIYFGFNGSWLYWYDEDTTTWLGPCTPAVTPLFADVKYTSYAVNLSSDTHIGWTLCCEPAECAYDISSYWWMTYVGGGHSYQYNFNLNDVWMIAGDMTDAGSGSGKIYIGCNGEWLCTYDEDTQLWSSALSPESTNAFFSHSGNALYAVSGFYDGDTSPTLKLCVNDADCLYSPPSGYVYAAEATTTLSLSSTDKTTLCELTNSLMTAEGLNASGIEAVRSNSNIGNKKWYVEIEIDHLISGAYVGVASHSFVITDPIGEGSHNWVLHNGTVQPDNFTIFPSNFSSVTVIRIACDMNSRCLWFGTDQHGWYGNPVTGSLPAVTMLPDTIYVLLGVDYLSKVTLVTSGFTYTPPTGYEQPTLGSVLEVHVLRDKSPMPLSQPTQHAMISALGL